MNIEKELCEISVDTNEGTYSLRNAGSNWKDNTKFYGKFCSKNTTSFNASFMET